MIHLESACNQISLGLQKEILKEKLVDSEFQKSAIIAGIPDLIFRIDRNGVFLDSHFHNTDQLYVPPGMFIGKSVNEIFDKKLSEKMIQAVKRSLDRNEIVILTYSLDTPGVTQHFEARMTPIHENEVIAVVRNITERVVSEQELKTKNQALETSPDAVFIVDSNTHHFIYINDAFIKITGFSENDIRDMFFDLEEARRNKLNWSNYLFRVKKKQEEIAAALKKDRFYKGDFISITKEGEPYWSFFSMQHMELSNNRSYFVGVIRDITEIRELERKLLNAVVETQETERRRIAADLHDGVGQTLTAVNMYFNALKDELSDHKETTELFTITSDLITKAIADTRMISHTLMPSSLNNFGLKQAIEEMVDRYNTLEMGIKINFTFDISDKKINSRVEIAIYRIIQEIISNAMKHSKAKNIFLTIYEEGENLVVTALDDGIGFNMEKVRRGLGLNSLETRVQSINGKLQIHTSEGKGTQIRINLPSQDLFQTTTNTEL
jgi:PAS domain S-box-containing protein